ncbi:HLA class II histocompatibility antigen, DR alpha chain-like [Rhynochetos jubatus]
MAGARGVPLALLVALSLQGAGTLKGPGSTQWSAVSLCQGSGGLAEGDGERAWEQAGGSPAQGLRVSQPRRACGDGERLRVGSWPRRSLAPCVGNTIQQAEFQQRLEPSQQGDGEYLQSFNADEVFHVDLEKQETVWRLPEFATFTSFEAQGALQNAAIGKHNLEIMITRSNRSQAPYVPPEVTVFPRRRVELGDPNVLICYADKFWPSVISLAWLRNGKEVTDGVLETVFYPREDNSFRKFSYLPFIPTRGDYYDCRVEHWGLPKGLLKHWEPQVPPPVSESTETLVCALGLAVGIVGIVVGTVLFIKAVKMRSARNQRGVL